MHEPRFKPLWRWEPLPYLILFVLVVIAGSIRPDAAPVFFWIAAALTAVALIYFMIAYVDYGRRARRNPDAAGNLRTLEGLTILAAEHVPGDIAPVVAVADVHRHQAAIDVVQAYGGARVRAVLVPRASRWLALRYRVAVQLVAGERIKLAGYLPDVADARWRERLGGLREKGVYVSVPARIRGTERPFAVELDFSGVDDALSGR